jgi:hypothetical protein
VNTKTSTNAEICDDHLDLYELNAIAEAEGRLQVHVGGSHAVHQHPEQKCGKLLVTERNTGI